MSAVLVWEGISLSAGAEGLLVVRPSGTLLVSVVPGSEDVLMCMHLTSGADIKIQHGASGTRHFWFLYFLLGYHAHRLVHDV